MNDEGASDIIQILEGILQSTLFAPSLITSVSELDKISTLVDQFSTFAILSPGDSAPLIQFVTKDLRRAHGNVEIVTFEECLERKSAGYRVMIVSRNPSDVELEAIKELLDQSTQVDEVGLLITSEVLERLESYLVSYQYENEIRENFWNLCVISKTMDLDLDEDDPCYDDDLIDDEDRIIQGEN